jgi:hypothetical protein
VESGPAHRRQTPTVTRQLRARRPHTHWDDETGLAEPSVAGNRMTLPIAEATGSIWMLDNVDK